MVKLSISPGSRWRSSERIALKILESMGYRIIDVHRKVIIKGVEVAEVDAIVENNKGKRYAVEIKAGRLDVSGIRQAYINAKLLGMKPLVICKGFVDDAAEATSRELGVEVIKVSDQFLVDSEELELIIRESVESVLDDYLSSLLTTIPQITENEFKILKAIAENPTLTDAAKDLNVETVELIDLINKLKRRGVLPKTKSYGEIRRRAKILMYKFTFEREISKLIDELKRLIKEIREAR